MKNLFYRILYISYAIIIIIFSIKLYLIIYTTDKKIKYKNIDYSEKKKKVLRDFKQNIKKNGKIKLLKYDSHLYRKVEKPKNTLDLNYFNQIISIDKENKIIHTEGLVRIDKLVDYTLNYNLAPMVVPELRSLTVGGLISGVGIESSSFKYGLFHDSVIEYEILTGNGTIVIANQDSNQDLYQNFPNSYGTFGYILSAKIKLMEIKPYIRVENIKFTNPKKFIDHITEYKNSNRDKTDFIDGIIFSTHEMYIMKGKMINEKPNKINHYRRNIYYKSISKIKTDYMKIKDYYWRYDSNYFYLGSKNNTFIQHPGFRFVFNSLLKTDKMNKLKKIKSLKFINNDDNEIIVNDLGIETTHFTHFLQWYEKTIQVYPVWVCPYKTIRNTFFEKGGKYNVDFGIGFGTKKTYNKNIEADKNYYKKLIDKKMYSLQFKKGLYSNTFLNRKQFWQLYGPEDKYLQVKKKYDSKNRFYDLYQKVVGNM
jgi:hypothetical protein